MASSTPNGKVKVLFVCLGNICRSPMAEAVFRELVDKHNLRDRFDIQSAGTGSWHAGERVHRGTREVLSRHGIDPNGLVAKQVSQDMLDHADYVVAMDSENLSDLRSWPIDQGKVSRLLDYAADINVRDVPDPYYDGRFELVYELARLGSQGLLKHIREQHAL
ncbi:MAG: low molecular weight phosphotyrosine protein phosphatase [Chloroflexi bacterium]|nr:low molecular weight phosphotyrosine protein phosphatase [Chloroflexota bacterium]